MSDRQMCRQPGGPGGALIVEVSDEIMSEAPNLAPKIAIVLSEHLEPWQRFDVAAFTIGGVAAEAGAVGERDVDALDNAHLPMFKDPVLVFGRTADELRRTAERARSRGVAFSMLTEALFFTFNDVDNRAAVASDEQDALVPVGLAFRCERRLADKILKGLKPLR